MRDTESRYWEHVTASCMTEESDDENGEKIVTHQLLWRSECECVVGLLPGGGEGLGAFITQVMSMSA